MPSSTSRPGSYEKSTASKRMAPRPGGSFLGVRAIGDLFGLVEDLEDPLAGRYRTLCLADPHPEHPERHDEHREQQVERKEVADRERARDDHPSGDEQDRGLGDERHEAQQGDVERPLPVRRERLVEHRVGRGRELLLAMSLLGERLHDVDPDDALLGNRRDVCELLLDVAQNRVGHVAVAVRDQDDHRHDRQRHESELPAVEEEDDAHDHDGDDVLREEDQPVTEEEANRLQVDRRTGHELADLATVVEAEREPQEVRVQIVPQVVLDGERLSARDETSSDHERRADDPEPDDQCNPECEFALVGLARDSVDHDTRQDRNEDAGDLRADREQRRDDERYAVRPQEPEQAHECAPVRSPWRLGVLLRHRTVRVRIVLEAVPNVSEGRDADAIAAIGAAFSTSARLLDVHSDPDHHRSVYTLAGDADDLARALLAGIAAACSLIDLRGHEGVHPRVGLRRRRAGRPAQAGGFSGSCRRCTRGRRTGGWGSSASRVPVRGRRRRTAPGVLPARRPGRARTSARCR